MNLKSSWILVLLITFESTTPRKPKIERELFMNLIIKIIIKILIKIVKLILRAIPKLFMFRNDSLGTVKAADLRLIMKDAPV